MTNKDISTATQSADGGQPATVEQKPRNYFIPAYSVRLVRDGSVKAETKLADSPERVAAIVRAYWGEGELDREHLVCLMINARSQVREAYSAYRTAHDLALHYRDRVVGRAAA